MFIYFKLSAVQNFKIQDYQKNHITSSITLVLINMKCVFVCFYKRSVQDFVVISHNYLEI